MKINPNKTWYQIDLEMCEAVIDVFNEITGKNIKQLPSNHKPILQRIRGSRKVGMPVPTITEYRKVIWLKNEQWANKIIDADKLKPSVLFGPNFWNYLEEANSYVRELDELPW